MEKIITTGKNRIRRLLCSRRGFSFAELLLATLIMLLSTSIITATITLAMNQYRRSMQMANASVLCTMLSNYVENELGSATIVLDSSGHVTTGRGGEFLFTSNSHKFGPGAYFALLDDDGRFLDYVKLDNSSSVGRLAETSIIYDDKYFKIAGDGAYKKSKDVHSLYSGMNVSYQSRALSVHIWVEDNTGDVLAENYFIVVPLDVLQVES